MMDHVLSGKENVDGCQNVHRKKAVSEHRNRGEEVEARFAHQMH